MDAWPAQLRQMVLLIMADPNPAVVYWGDEMTIVYNEAYVDPTASLRGRVQRIGRLTARQIHTPNRAETPWSAGPGPQDRFR